MKALLEKIQVVDEHGLVNFYFGEPQPDSEDFDVKKMQKLEAELIAANGLRVNKPAEDFIKVLQEQTHGYHNLKDLFAQAILLQDELSADIAVNLIKTSTKVLNLLKVYSSSGFIKYNSEKNKIFVQKDPTRRRYTDLELTGLNREVFF